MKVRGADLAKYLGKTNSLISTNVKRGNLVRDEKKLFDLDDPKNKDWCIRKGIDISKLKDASTFEVKTEKKTIAKKKPVQSQKKEPVKIPEFEENISDSEFEDLSGLPAKMRNLTIDQLVVRYGGPMQLKGYVEILAKILTAQKADVSIQEKRKELIPKSLVDYLKEYINTLHNQLYDYADGCASDIIAISVSDKKLAKQKIPEMLRKDFSKLQKETTRRIDGELRNLKVDGDDE